MHVIFRARDNIIKNVSIDEWFTINNYCRIFIINGLLRFAEILFSI